MIRFFSLRPDPETGGRGAALPRQRSGGSAGAGSTVACESYEPGHLMHYVQQGRALRSTSVKAAHVLVDDQVVIVDLADGRTLEWHHHDPVRLRSVLHLFPSSRVVYLEHHALRLGPYWFNCSPEPLGACPRAATPLAPRRG